MGEKVIESKRGAAGVVPSGRDEEVRDTARVRAALPLVGLFIFWLVGVAVVVLSIVQDRGFRLYLLELDFRAYYTAGRMVLGGVRAGFYDLPTQYLWQHQFAPEFGDQSYLMPFLNPPFIAIAVAPLAWLPLQVAYLAWAAVNVALLALVCWLLLDVLGGAGSRIKLRALVMSLTFLPVIVTVMQGQLSFVLVLALLLSWRALRSGRDLQGGLWLTLLLVKPQLALVPALALVWKRRLRALGGLALGGAAALLISLLMVGWDGLQGYLRLVLAASSWGDAYTIHPRAMHTWRGFLHLLLRTDNLADVQPWWPLGVAVALGLLLWGWRGRWSAASSRFDLQWALLVVVVLFTSPHANWHDLSLLLVPGALVVRYLADGGQAGVQYKLLVALPFLGYLAVWANSLGISDLRLQFSVVIMVVALLVLSWASGQTERESLVELAE